MKNVRALGTCGTIAIKVLTLVSLELLKERRKGGQEEMAENSTNLTSHGLTNKKTYKKLSQLQKELT